MIMKFFLYTIAIFIAINSIGCKGDYIPPPAVTQCSASLKLDTIWQVQLDTNIISEIFGVNPQVINNQLIYYVSKFPDSGPPYYAIESRNTKTGEIVFTKKFNQRYNIYTGPFVTYANKLYYPNDSVEGLYFFDLQNQIEEKYTLPSPLFNSVLKQLGEMVFGCTQNLKDSTVSFFSFSLKTKAFNIFNTLKRKFYSYDYPYEDIQPFISAIGDTLLYYSTGRIEDIDGINYHAGEYNLSKKNYNFDKKLGFKGDKKLFYTQHNTKNIFFRNNDDHSPYFFSIDAYKGDTILNVFEPQNGFFKLYDNNVYIANYQKGLSTFDAETGFLKWNNFGFPLIEIYSKIEIVDDLLFVGSQKTLTIADVSSGCIHNNIVFKNLTSNYYSIKFCLDKPNRLLYIFGSDYKLTCMKF